MKLSLIIFIILLPQIVSAQLSLPNEMRRSNMGLNIGINYSKFNNDLADYNYATKFLVGTYRKYRISDRLYCKSSLNYSLKGSTSDQPFSKFENHYIDLDIIPQYRLSDDFFFHGGVSLSGLLASFNVITNDESLIGTRRVFVEGFNSEINFLTGIEFRLTENINLSFNYIIPASPTNTNNFQISACINLTNRKPKVSYSTLKSDKSESQINELRNGVLLVRLHNSKKILIEMKKSGRLQEAEKLESFNRSQNLAVYSAFNNHFDFCEVRFFYSSYSDSIREKEYKNVFLNDSLEIDTTISIYPNESVFIAEFCNIDQDTMKYFSHMYIRQLWTLKFKKVDTYYKGTDFNFYGLVVKDHNFVQLNSPFPYYVKSARYTYNEAVRHILFLPQKHTQQIKKSVISSVISLDTGLKRYYRLKNI